MSILLGQVAHKSTLVNFKNYNIDDELSVKTTWGSWHKDGTTTIKTNNSLRVNSTVVCAYKHTHTLCPSLPPLYLWLTPTMLISVSLSRFGTAQWQLLLPCARSHSHCPDLLPEGKEDPE